MYEFLAYRVCDAMISDPVTIDRETRLVEVEALFEQHDFNGLPVVDENSRLLGLVTKLDLLRAFSFTPQSIVPPYQEIMDQPAERIMTREPVTVSPDLPLTRVLQIMIETRNKSFPVTDGSRLVGIIAREDVLKALRRAVAGERP